ncbi:MAG: DUF1127 domain-containing protein [Paracoccaceae bacterium]|jgi:uncharacterized protein YjiS (DUF1127 family)
MTYINERTACTSSRHTSWIASLTRLFAVARQRQALKALDDVALDDIGLSRDEADVESRRALWDAPETWRC